MKYYLVWLTCYDGAHEHTYRAVAKGKTYEEVTERLELEQTYDCMGDKEPHENSLMSFGDDLTARVLMVYSSRSC